MGCKINPSGAVLHKKAGWEVRGLKYYLAVWKSDPQHT